VLCQALLSLSSRLLLHTCLDVALGVLDPPAGHLLGVLLCWLPQVILEEAFPDLVEAGTGVDVRTAIEQPGNLQQVGPSSAWQHIQSGDHGHKSEV